MSLYVSGLICVLGAALLSGSIAYLVRRIGADEGRVDNNDAAGQVFTIVGGLHAVLLAFVLISLFDTVSAAEEGAFAEADGLVAATWAAEALPEPARTQIREGASAYAGTVLSGEWPQMRDGTEVTGPGWTDLNQMRMVVDSTETDSDWQTNRKIEAANQLWQVYQARHERLDAAGSQVSTVVWFALISGSCVAVLLPYLFGGTRLGTHVVIVSTLAATITLLLFAIYQLQNPFSGGAQVDPDAFRSALDRLG